MSDNNNGVEEVVVPKTDDTGTDETRKPAEDEQEVPKVDPPADKVDTISTTEQEKPSDPKEPEKKEEDAKEGEKVEDKREPETDGAAKTEAQSASPPIEKPQTPKEPPL
jgi:hypothetical protein